MYQLHQLVSRVQQAGVKSWLLCGAVCLAVKLSIRLDPHASPYVLYGPALAHTHPQKSVLIIT